MQDDDLTFESVDVVFLFLFGTRLGQLQQLPLPWRSR
jgi:hypothetical protein